MSEPYDRGGMAESGRFGLPSARGTVGARVAERIASLTPEQRELTDRGAEIIKAGGLVAFPTETVYGLGANALDAEAVKKIYETKGRPSDNPLILHVSSIEMTEALVEINWRARFLMERFWPGPLSIVLPAKEIIPARTRGGLSTAAVRMPDTAAALALIEKSGLPVAAPSANISGRPSPTDAETVRQEIGRVIPLVIDGGDTRLGLESTVIDMTGDHPVLLRPGGLPKETVEEALNMEVLLPQDQKMIRRSPGTRYRHYAPAIPLKLSAPQETPADADNWAWLGTGNPAGSPCVKIIFRDDAEYAKELFRALRTLERSGARIIYAELPAEKGIGRALKDRLIRAAGE
ncbi:L-threonylcarbamoyladenylate synthase [Cloacibacillus evryensis]|uniref:Threonylcarbamoyl-AMP synthase n=1 Tax=Cloacibacillus evryensis TaxID=508460 RepID=A0AAW5K630_9BACT|nr:L-threonylcarbamoyladenylate synthase [Cloacibacillus evryensis]MCQ4763789.1 L-threonylcarbamoyladenylate synthase [Cloacibacillus evryensis]MCQ4813434.1 L-threonylcarbamoyladenylate synthase [Cloacibacillus evryensis]